jgi:hypothetical protein
MSDDFTALRSVCQLEDNIFKYSPYDRKIYACFWTGITSCRVNDIRNLETWSAVNVFAFISNPADGIECKLCTLTRIYIYVLTDFMQDLVTILSASDIDFTVQRKITPDWDIKIIDHNDVCYVIP